MTSRPVVLACSLAVVISLVGVACSSDSDGSATGGAPDATTSTTAAPSSTAPDAATVDSELVSFTAEVWADNWFSLTVNGEAVGEDGVPITTERSFNSETIDFEATYPLTVAMVTKDFKEDDSGLEYIGTSRQQMGDGGFIAQITDNTTGEVVLVTDGTWKGLAIHRAPLNTECESSSDPATECEAQILAEPDGWTDADFDDAGFETATVHSEADVQPKEGYDEIVWDPDAELIWTSDLEVDNTILWRATVAGPNA